MCEKLEKIKAIRWENGEYEEVDELTVLDEYTYLYIDLLPPRKFATYPKDLEDFAVGYCLGEGLIKSYTDIVGIKVVGSNVNVLTKFKHSLEEDFESDEVLQEKKGGGKHACVCRLLEYQGVESDSAGGPRSELKDVEPVKTSLKVKAETIIQDMEYLTKSAKVWTATGGVHVAMLKSGDNFIIREDVSRHVAVDKVIGAGCREGYDLNKSYIVYSGRMPADMLIKVVRVNIPLIISNAAPASSGYKIAKENGITMVGFLRGNRFNLYTNSDRIVL